MGQVALLVVITVADQRKLWLTRASGSLFLVKPLALRSRKHVHWVDRDHVDRAHALKVVCVSTEKPTDDPLWLEPGTEQSADRDTQVVDHDRRVVPRLRLTAGPVSQCARRLTASGPCQLPRRQPEHQQPAHPLSVGGGVPKQKKQLIHLITRPFFMDAFALSNHRNPSGACRVGLRVRKGEDGFRLPRIRGAQTSRRPAHSRHSRQTDARLACRRTDVWLLFHRPADAKERGGLWISRVWTV